MNFLTLLQTATQVGSAIAAATQTAREIAANIDKAKDTLSADEVEQLHAIYNRDMLHETSRSLDAAIEAARARHRPQA